MELADKIGRSLLWLFLWGPLIGAIAGSWMGSLTHKSNAAPMMGACFIYVTASSYLLAACGFILIFLAL